MGDVTADVLQRASSDAQLGHPVPTRLVLDQDAKQGVAEEITLHHLFDVLDPRCAPPEVLAQGIHVAALVGGVTGAKGRHE